MNDYGYIILRDIPKDQVLIDNIVYNIQGGFRGFQNVIPGLHYVSIKDDGEFYGFWCFLKADTAIVKVYNSSKKEFEDDDPDNYKHYSQLALSGAMNKALIQYDLQNGINWQKIVLHIDSKHFPPRFFAKEEIPLGQKRFDIIIEETHKKNIKSFLNEFEYSFAKWRVEDDDKQALERYAYLIFAIYYAGKWSMLDYPELFKSIIDVIIAQLNYIESSALTEGSIFIQNYKYFIEDLQDTNREELIKKAGEFAEYLTQRGIIKKD